MPTEENDITIGQADRIAEHLMPRFELAMQRRLQPIEERLGAIEQTMRAAGKAYHAVTAAVTFVVTLFGNWAMRDRQ